MIIFNEKFHTYTNTETNRKYTSVTTLLGKYKKPFDSAAHSKRVAEREGVTQEFVLESWRETTKIATDRGTKIHKLMEDFVKVGEVDEEYNYLYKSYSKFVINYIGNYKKILSEELLFLHDYEVAGTSDLIYERDNDFIVADFKTNKKYRFSNDFNDYFKAPIDHLPYCEFNTYALQLSMYAYMFEQKTGKKCNKIVTLYLEDDKWIPYHANYLKTDIINILENYKLQQKK
jgi:ATP-dependent exoDNAse (exonuclease V) beta subunit